VDPADLERIVAELETSVDRLRALYDQYFLGIEKLEPAVAHKEVERRIHALRREQIRNTAQRFRFQMVLQRLQYSANLLAACVPRDRTRHVQQTSRARRAAIRTKTDS